MSRAETLIEWSDHLRGLALRGERDLDSVLAAGTERRGSYARSFRDERGHRRAVDGPFLAHVLSLPAPEAPTSSDLAVRLWAACARDEAREPPDVSGPPLIDPVTAGSIEVWTEAELSALQALRWLAMRGSGELRTLVARACAWHLEHLQPDNATNHPWAVAVFVEHWALETDASARVHAETLVHNCLVQSGRPDRFSAWVLADSAQQLRAAAKEGRLSGG